MSPKVDKEVIFFLASVGKHPCDGDVDHFEKTKEIMTLIIEKKILLRPQDEVGIMLAAHSADDDEHACTYLYKENDVPSWKTVKDVQKLKQSDKVFDDWNTALSNTLKQIEENVEAVRVILILIFDCHPTCPGIEAIDAQAIAESVAGLNIQLLWIGSKPLKDLSEDKLNESEKVLMDVVKLANGEYMTTEKTLPSLRIFKKINSRFIAWKCDLELGNIRIPTSTYVQTTRSMKTPSFQMISTTDDNLAEKPVYLKPNREYVDRYKHDHPTDDTISGYMYGRQCIPVPEADKAGMAYNAGPKSLMVYAFVAHDAIALEDLCGDSSRFVIPQSPLAEKAFYCLAHAMKNANCVAIVRRIYQTNNCPKMGLLIPHIVPGDPWGFIYIEILYAEDRRVQRSCPLNSVKKRLTKEHESAVGNLIDSMMLTSSDDKPEPFFPGTVHSPGLQHLYNCLIHRALNPVQPVPEMDINLRKLIETPESIKINSEPFMKKIRDLFPISGKQVSSKKAAGTTVEVSVPALCEVKKIDNEVEENMDVSPPEEPNAVLDELFDPTGACNLNEVLR